MVDARGSAADGALESKAPSDLRTGTDSHTVIRGRRWRRTDPAIDDNLRQHLVDALMDARRDVKAGLTADDDEAIRRARSRVHDAKVALGERGPKWWEPITTNDVDARVDSAMRSLARGSINQTRKDVRTGLRLRPHDMPLRSDPGEDR